MNPKRYFLAVLAAAMLIGLPAGAEESSFPNKTEISTGQYVGGGVAGTILPFGIGHAIQGRWSEKGWIFTAGGFAGLSLALLSGEIEELSYAAGIALLGLRIWEIIDVWSVPSHYKIVKDSPYQIYPLASFREESMDLGLSFKYRF